MNIHTRSKVHKLQVNIVDMISNRVRDKNHIHIDNIYL